MFLVLNFVNIMSMDKYLKFNFLFLESRTERALQLKKIGPDVVNDFYVLEINK